MSEQDEQDQAENGEDKEAAVSMKDEIGELFDAQIAEAEPEDEGDSENAEIEEVSAALDEEAGEDDTEAESESEDEAEAEEEPFAAPHHYSDEDKALFDGLPKEQREFLLKKAKATDDSYAQRAEELADVRKEHSAITEAFKPVEQLLVQNGMDHVTAVRRLVGAQTHLMANPGEALALLATQYAKQDPQGAVRAVATALGVQLPGSAQDEGEDFLDPAMAERVSQLDQRVRQSERERQEQAQTAEQQRGAQAQQAIDSFSGAVDDKGKPLHPHFERVQGVMAAFVAQGISPDLEDAYKRAVMSDSELSEAVFKERSDKTAKEREAARKKEVEKAKKASRNVKSERTPAAASPAPAKSTKDDIRQTLDQWESEHAG